MVKNIVSYTANSTLIKEEVLANIQKTQLFMGDGFQIEQIMKEGRTNHTVKE
jgi:hypothetical protein